MKNTNKWFLDTDFTSEQTHGGYSPSDVEVLPAPQMHEIAPLLPPFSNSSYQTVFQKTLKNELVYCENVEERLFVSVENHHYAQAYAELFIKLKEKNLLPNGNSH